MNKLLQQIAKFGIVGVVCFFIDYIVGIVTMNVAMRILGEASFSMASAIGAVCGFVVSVIANYILSFMFVFERKENLDRRAEFVIFLILSVIGMGINSFLMWGFTGPVYGNSAMLQELLSYNKAYTVGKVIATGVVMVYNFITRKIFLEKKEK